MEIDSGIEGVLIEAYESSKNHRKILAACSKWPSLLPTLQFVGDREIVYLPCHTARPTMTCDGLVCFPEPDWINVVNPSTRQLLRFPSGLKHRRQDHITFLGDWVMGFGKDKVTGRYKVVTMCFPETERWSPHVMQCSVLAVEMDLPPYCARECLGYLAAGILIGPYGFSIIRNVHATKAIAECIEKRHSTGDLLN